MLRITKQALLTKVLLSEQAAWVLMKNLVTFG